MKSKNLVYSVLLLVIAGFILMACATPNQLAQQKALAANQNFAPYEIKNYIEQKYYSWRLEISDDPALILWCTVFPPTPNVKPMTFPIVGKLVSSGKRPFSETDGISSPDAQSMYGSSGEYRYGFGPTGKMEYYDFTGVATTCTTQPLVWQTQMTVMVQSKDNVLLSASQQAHDLLVQGRGAEAQAVLDAAMAASQGGQP